MLCQDGSARQGPPRQPSLAPVPGRQRRLSGGRRSAPGAPRLARAELGADTGDGERGPLVPRYVG